jgi:hypothetical protein
MVDKVYEATFKLSKKCECTDVKNSKTIELKIRKRMGHRWITGFKIKIFDPKLDVTRLQAKMMGIRLDEACPQDTIFFRI